MERKPQRDNALDYKYETEIGCSINNIDAFVDYSKKNYMRSTKRKFVP